LNKAIFLDRDGVLNEAIIINNNPFPPRDLNEVNIINGVKDALFNLKKAGFKLIVITNQPDVARGTTNMDTVKSINNYLMKQLPLDSILVCYHDDTDKCSCRKPLPGNIFQGAKKFKVDLSKSYIVGDRWKDIEAGAAAGCTTFFIDNNYNKDMKSIPNYFVRSLSEASKIILDLNNENH
jgi:D-glycero-D-manno-heptose 1,7-bisphosphate phosphatase